MGGTRVEGIIFSKIDQGIDTYYYADKKAVKVKAG